MKAFYGLEVLDFGNVYVKSTVVKSFSVFNDLPQAKPDTSVFFSGFSRGF